MAEKSKSPETSQPKVEVGADLSSGQDFFHYPDKDPNCHYHWAANNPLKVQRLQREGYEVVNAPTSSQSKEQVDHQRELLKRKIASLDTPPEQAKAAKEMLDRMESGNVATSVNIPEHVMMRTSNENWEKRQAQKKARSDSMEASIKQSVEDLSKALKRSGLGGMKAFKDLFDRVKG
jgi:hypothetical protein